MFNKLKEAINQGPLVIIEGELNKMIRNKTFIKATSMQINFLLWLQKSSKWQREWVLKNMQIPTEDGLKGLYETMNRLEAENENLKKEIIELKSELQKLNNTHFVAPKVKVATKSTKITKTRTPVNKTVRKSKKLDNSILM